MLRQSLQELAISTRGRGFYELTDEVRGLLRQTRFNTGLATLLIDLLTKEEEMIDLQTAELRFDIPLLADRLGGVTDWLAEPKLLECPCHMSQYNPRADGALVAGPAPRALPALPLKIADGKLMVAKPFTSRVGFTPPGG